jgi:hypothetical protein
MVTAGKLDIFSQKNAKCHVRDKEIKVSSTRQHGMLCEKCYFVLGSSILSSNWLDGTRKFSSPAHKMHFR